MKDSDKLRLLAEGREDYLRGVHIPTHSGEVEAMDVTDLMIWTEVCAARRLADYLDNPETAWGWLPSWRYHEWDLANQAAAK